jgi:hypothetical protein
MAFERHILTTRQDSSYCLDHARTYASLFRQACFVLLNSRIDDYCMSRPPSERWYGLMGMGLWKTRTLQCFNRCEGHRADRTRFENDQLNVEC